MQDPDVALEALTADLDKLKQALHNPQSQGRSSGLGDAHLNVCLRGLDNHNWSLPKYSALVFALARNAHPIVEVKTHTAAAVLI